ncbi:MAG: phenylalanine--tRNA ligase subunit beta [Pseudomonadota bacterium]
MRFSEAWLREWVDPQVDTATLAEQLTMAGLEVDTVDPAAPDFSGVVVGRVLSLQQHPDADKLRVCQVDAGSGDSLQIICGASNVAQGMRVPVATVGAVLPGDFKIKKAKLRGVESFGMICSAAELGLAESSDGIMPLPDDAPVGTDFRDYLQLDDQCIEVDLTPNRGDCLSVAGMAREVGVINRAALAEPDVTPLVTANQDVVEVRLEAAEACPRYLCRVVRGINAAAPTPLWMQERLRRSGLRSLGAVVDVTNYVLLELGQPMHAFDLDRVKDQIRVRFAADGEKLTLLGGEELELDDDSLVIADADRALALAGVMGGQDSGVTPETRDILLESAFFAPTAIIGKSRRYGLHTDSSHRFERGVDPALQRRAMERATALLLPITGGQPGPVTEQTAPGFVSRREAVILRRERLARVLGLQIADDMVEDILTRLGMEVETTEEGWRATPPAARFDIAIEADLVEEIGRVYGYNRIPDAAGEFGMSIEGQPEGGLDLMRIKRVLSDRDYHEVITYSFISPDLARELAPGVTPIPLANPISTDMSVMRPTLWGGLIETAKYNRARQEERVRIFESGLRFIPQQAEIKQENVISGLLQGNALAEQWGVPGRQLDFFDLKGDLEVLLDHAGDRHQYRFVADSHPVLHPGQSARIERDGVDCGWAGLLHPRLERALDIDTPTFLFELALDLMAPDAVPEFQSLSRFPAVRRDLAIVLDRQVSYDNVKKCVDEAAPGIIRDMHLFDVYTGETIESNRKSLALRLILQDSSRTLTEQDVSEAMHNVLDALESKLDARLRD